MKSVRPEFEKIMATSPSCFFLPEPTPGEDDADEGDFEPRGCPSAGLPVCDLDETSATREEQALAWAWCADDDPKNYLMATVNWIYREEGSDQAMRAIPLSLLEKRLGGANIKPNNRLTNIG